MSTSVPWQRRTGKIVGPRLDQNPWSNVKARRASKAGAVLVPPDHVSERKRALRDLAKIQAARPLKPPGKR